MRPIEASTAAQDLSSFYRLRHPIREGDLERDQAIVAAALDRIEHDRQGHAYLVGDAFTVADLTAAALLGPLLSLPKFDTPAGRAAALSG